MKISKRLSAISELIPDNAFFLDIGCDHALLDIYTVKNKKKTKAIASDINEGPYQIALENVKKYKLEDKIKVVKKDGLDAYQKGVDTIILSGLGTNTIIEILKRGNDKLENISKIIVSSNNDYYNLRKSIVSLGFVINNEVIICEKEKYYPIIVFTKGTKKYKKYEYKYGPILLNNSGKVYKDYLKFNKKKLLKIYNNLKNKYIYKKIIIKKEIKFLSKYI